MSTDTIIHTIITKFKKGAIDQLNPDDYNFQTDTDIFFGLHCSIQKMKYTGSNHSYKMNNFFPLYKFITKTLIRAYTSTDLTKTNSDLLDEFLKVLISDLTVLVKGQILLIELKYYIDKLMLSKDDILNCLISSSQTGSMGTFMFWLGKNKLEDLDSFDLKTIMVHSIKNSDDRLYKYVLDKILSTNKLLFQTNVKLINEMLKTLAESHIPNKYILKRIKLMSNHISLIPYFDFMFSVFNEPKITIQLHKYYYVKPHTFKNIAKLCTLLITFNFDTADDFVINNEGKQILNSILKTDEEKLMVNIIMAIKYGIDFEVNHTNLNQLEKIVVNNDAVIILTLALQHLEIQKLLNVKSIQHIIKILTNYNLVTKGLLIMNQYIYIPRLFLFTRFFLVDNLKSKLNNNEIIKINYLLHSLRLFAKRKYKTKTINYKVNKFNLLCEVKSFTPNKTIPALKNGSHIFQLQKQKFTNLPPRHLLPGEITLYKNFLLREKADGILINNLPTGIYPQVDLINNYQVKAEYIEDLDLYLLFDIDIPNTTIEERYQILRNAHPFTNHLKMETIDSLDQFMNCLEKERKIIQQFINSNNKETIKWFPKFACYFDLNLSSNYLQFISDITHKVLMESDPTFNQQLRCSEPYQCDGLILSPINGAREIKIKPKSLLTIDLLFDGQNWIDKNKYNWSKNIMGSDKNIKTGRIYRCYPKILNTQVKFEVGEIRYDKKNPNPNFVVNNIINIVNYDWTRDNDINTENIYYDTINKLSSKNLIETINSQNKLLEQKIMNLCGSSINNSWLDLGCGRGKLIPLIKNYCPKYYLGLDTDIKQLVRALHYHDENQNVYQFNPCNLGNDWNDSDKKWYYNETAKFNFVVANFSLMHFCNDLFWSQLNDVTYSGSKFLFNLVDPTNVIQYWSESNSFLKIENNVVTYKFEWVHTENKSEPLITNELLDSYLNKYGWKIINKTKPNSKYQLLNMYCWWVVEKV